MLHLMRKHAGTWMIKVILGAIVIVFVFWGVGSYTSQRSVKVASVNGEIISLDDYRATYNRLLDQMRRNFGNNLNDELLRTLGLEKQALEQLIDRRLMLQAAEELKIRVADGELVDAVRSIPAFQANGNFDPDRYRRVLGANRIAPEEFELSQREDMVIAKLNSLITGSAKVSDLEIESVFKSENASVELSYLLFDPGTYDKISPDMEAVRGYFEENKEKYKTEPMRKARYLHFDRKQYLSRVEVTEGEIADYYENHLEEYQVPKTVEARHILIKVDPQASPEDEQKARARIEEILEMARGGQDFAELARKYSEGPSRDRGGFLGEFRRDVMVKPFADVAFSTPAGEISDPVRTQFGWHLIKVEKVNPAKTKSLGEAGAEIKNKLADERAGYIAYDEAEAVFESIFDGEDLDAAARTRNLAVTTTDLFDRGGPEKNVGNRAQFAQAAFDLPIGDVSEIIDLGDGYYLIQPTEEQPARIPELDAVIENVKADLVAKLQREAAVEDARAALAEVKAGKKLGTVASAYGLEPESTGYFKRNDAVEGIGRETAVAAVAFNLSESSKWPDDVVETSRGVYLLQFKGARTADLSELEGQKDAIRQRLLQQKQYRAVEAWLDSRREKSEISIEPNLRDS